MAIVSSETLILFIATVLVAGSVAGALTGGVNQLSNALGDRSVDVSQEIRTDIDIISDSSSSAAIYDGTNITLLVKNTGSNTLSTDPTTLDVLVDGVYRSNVTTTLVSGDAWDPGEVMRINVTDVSLTGTDHRVVIDVHGNTEVFEFRT